MNNVLTIEQLSVVLDGNAILSAINLAVKPGDIIGLVGPSGCGKTTLLNTIAGFIEQQSGQITIKEQLTISPKQPLAPEHRHIGMIFQDYALFPHLTVYENIAFGIHKLTAKQQTSRIDSLLELLKLDDFAKRFPHELSGGQQQRVAIARALATRPSLLLLDEPFSNIDARLRNELMIEIRQLLKQLEISAIFVTHNKDEVFTFADQVAVMHEGEILQTGSPVAVCQQPNSWQVADFLQLGSWLPVTSMNNELFTALGRVNSSSGQCFQKNGGQLLVKPKMLRIDNRVPVNAEINHIAVTEQGYHYYLHSIACENNLAFNQLSFHSEQAFRLGEQLSLVIKPHELVLL